MMRNRRYAKDRERHRTLFPGTRKLLSIGCGVIAAVAFVGVVFFSPFFTIEFVDIEAQGGIEEGAVRAHMFAQMEQKRFWLFSQKNIFFFSSKQAQEALSQRFVLERSAISKRYPHTLRVSATGKQFRLLLIGKGTVLDLASDGTPSADLSQDRSDTNPSAVYARTLAMSYGGGTPPIPKEEIDAPLVLSDSLALDRETVMFIRAVFAQSRDRGYRPLLFYHKQNTPSIRLKTSQGWDILFSLIEDPESQIKNVGTILDTYFQKKDRRSLDYIDVRFDRRVFYKED
ncbi:hypothetical protein HY623_01490 [Candidatus Uhrbacteria bacterium]|nr:hypothetical protein [Candidatus Uhrbacteria bacterium]